MGALIKIILFGFVFYYIMKTVGGFIYRILGGRDQQNQQRTTYREPTKREGEIKIDHDPEATKKRRGAASNEGDYIDYEEIK